MSYVTEVVEFVAARRDSPTVFSPSEYAVIAEWEKQEIPMRLILGVIEKAGNGTASKTAEQLTINELDKVVALRYADWLRNKNGEKGA